MTAEAAFLVVVLLAALVLFYTGWVRPDVTALLVMLSMILPWRAGPDGMTGILSVQEGFSGFGSPAVIMVASMFVLSAAMVRTGAAQLIGGRVLAAGAATELRFQVTVLGVVTLFSAFVNDTTTVLVWMPMVLAICRERGYAPSRVLLLLAYASLLGGQWTLIGTRSNLVISDYLRARTGEGLSFFGFTPVAVAIWLAVLGAFLLFARRLLPSGGRGASMAERYEVQEYLTEAMASPDSELIGKSLAELDLRSRHDVTVLQVVRGKQVLPPSPWLRLQPEDVLIVQGRITKITELLSSPGLQVREELALDEKTLRSADLRMAEAVVAPNTELVGRSLGALEFHRSHGISVLAIRRRGHSVPGRLLNVRLQAGDALLLVGHASEIDRLRLDPAWLLLESRALPAIGKLRAYVVLALMACMVGASVSGLLSPSIVIPLVAVAAILLRCVGMRDAYESIDLAALVVVGGMIPFGLALEKTGSAHALAQLVADGLDGMPPVLLFAAVMLLAVLGTQLIENAAVAIVLAPVAYELAVSSGAEPVPYLLGLAICVSSAFLTPVAHESTILVMGPGGYRFRDYLRLGLPFAVLTWLVTVVVVPWLYPLGG